MGNGKGLRRVIYEETRLVHESLPRYIPPLSFLLSFHSYLSYVSCSCFSSHRSRVFCIRKPRHVRPSPDTNAATAVFSYSSLVSARTIMRYFCVRSSRATLTASFDPRTKSPLTASPPLPYPGDRLFLLFFCGYFSCGRNLKTIFFLSLTMFRLTPKTLLLKCIHPK